MKIGILTAGGDAPGLNAAIRAVTGAALACGDEVIGVHDGWGGLMRDGHVVELGRAEVASILPLGGTILGASSTCDPLMVEGGIDQVAATVRGLGLDAIVAIGGDGTLRIASVFAEMGLPVTAIPKTIDNDLSGTDYCLGFDSAVAVVVEALDRLHTTAASHHHVMVIEVMGRDTGWLAVNGGIAGGADMIIIPEFPVSLDDLVNHLHRRRDGGADCSLVVVAEGADLGSLKLLRSGDAEDVERIEHFRMGMRGVGERLASLVERTTKIPTRATVLGRTQRGGMPTAHDRIWATRVGVAAHRFAREGRFGCMPVVRESRIAEAQIADVAMKNVVPREWYELARVFF
jgi:ATP-dependent phosphofructokinase / diphosphate-dependent phosphofructokinase